jgi:predicted YcjX-like family ATPase
MGKNSAKGSRPILNNQAPHIVYWRLIAMNENRSTVCDLRQLLVETLFSSHLAGPNVVGRLFARRIDSFN